MSKLFTLALSFLLLFSLGCKKKEENLSKTEILTRSSWKLTALTVEPPANGITNLFDQNPKCVTDNITFFTNDKKYTIEEGVTKCADNNPTINDQGSWAFSSDEKNLSFTSSNPAFGKTEYELVSLDKSKFVGKTRQTTNGTNFVLTWTFSAQ
jgi:hypothetical protein